MSESRLSDDEQWVELDPRGPADVQDGDDSITINVSDTVEMPTRRAVPRHRVWIPVDRDYLELARGHGEDHAAGLINWLNVETLDYLNYLTPTAHDHVVREWLLGRVRKFVHDKFGSPPPEILDALSRGEDPNPEWFKDETAKRWADVVPIGSFRTGMYLPKGDLDMTIVTNHKEDEKEFLRKLCAKLRTSHFVAKSHKVKDITMARVPIIKFEEKDTGLEVDISYRRLSGLHSTKFLAKYLAHPKYGGTVRGIVMLVKLLMANKGLDVPFAGGIGSYAITILVIHFIQNLTDASFEQQTSFSHMIGALFMAFLKYYGGTGVEDFDTETMGICYEAGESGILGKFVTFLKSERSIPQENKICIIDPHEPTNDVGGPTSKVKEIKNVFQQAYIQIARTQQVLLEALEKNNDSVLKDRSFFDTCLVIPQSQTKNSQKRKRLLTQIFLELPPIISASTAFTDIFFFIPNEEPSLTQMDDYFATLRTHLSLDTMYYESIGYIQLGRGLERKHWILRPDGYIPRPPRPWEKMGQQGKKRPRGGDHEGPSRKQRR